MEMSSSAYNRNSVVALLMAELKNLNNTIHDRNRAWELGLMIINVDFQESDIFHWTITIKGPENSPYSEGLFLVTMDFPAMYPLEPPKVSFSTKIYHPNVNHGDGTICLPILDPGRWCSNFTVEMVLFSIVNLLENPNLEDALLPEIAYIYETDKDDYEEIARLWTRKYALGSRNCSLRKRSKIPNTYE